MNNKRILEDNIYKQISNLEFKTDTSNGIVTTKIKLSDNLYTHVNMNLIMKSSNDDTIAQMFNCINPNQIFIHDFKSNIEDEGYGKQLLIYFDYILNKFNLNVSYIIGDLVPLDYQYWKKSIHLYSHYIKSYGMIINNTLSPNEFIGNINKYKNQINRFKIFIKNKKECQTI